MSIEGASGMESKSVSAENADKAEARFEELKARIFGDAELHRLAKIEEVIVGKRSIVEDLSRQQPSDTIIQNIKEVEAEIAKLTEELKSSDRCDEYTVMRKEMKNIQMDVEYLRKH